MKISPLKCRFILVTPSVPVTTIVNNITTNNILKFTMPDVVCLHRSIDLRSEFADCAGREWRPLRVDVCVSADGDQLTDRARGAVI